MSDKIFILHENGELVEMSESGFLTEDQFQKLLAKYPDLLAGNQIDPENPRRWLLIAREIGVHDSEVANSRWSLDHLFIDQDSVPTLVEVKRSTDTRLRREVIGQILDYAANGISFWSLDEIRNRFEKQCATSGADAEQVLSEFLMGEKDEANFWEAVKTNFAAGKIRMLIVADTIPRELQRIIEFLNDQMSPAEILGVEVKQFLGKNAKLQTLVPRVVGLTARAEQQKKAAIEEKIWTEASFMAEFEKRQGVAEAAVAQKIVNFMRPHVGYFWFGKGTKDGSIFPMLPNRTTRWTFCIWTSGGIEVQFQYIKNTPPFDDLGLRKEFQSRLNQIKGVAIPDDRLEKRPSFRVQLLLDEQELVKFFDALNWFIAQFKSH